MRIFFAILFFFIAAISSSAQTKLFVSLKDATTQQPISNASVTVAPQMVGGVTDKGGKIELNTSGKINSITISHLQYGDTTLFLKASESSVNIELLLRKKTTFLEQATIVTGPDTVYGHTERHVADFLPLSDGLLILSYEHRKRIKKEHEQGKELFEGCKLIWLDQKGNITNQHAVNHTCASLIQGAGGQSYLETRDGYYHILVSEDMFYLQPVDNQTFINNIRPVVGILTPDLIGTTFHEQYPAFDVFAFNQHDSLARYFAHVEDRELMEQFRSEFKFMSTRGKLEAFRYERKTGIDKEIVAAYMTGFTEGIYYKPLYCPVFTSDSSIYLFNHVDHQLEVYSHTYGLSFSADLTYSKAPLSKSWDELVLFDQVGKKAYTVMEKNGKVWLYEIDLKTGELGPSISIGWKYPERIKVHGNEVYYLYRPFESPQNTFLYKEQLPAFFN